ncbi:MAG: GGDEF domain-containing protein [Comamonas sp.]
MLLPVLDFPTAYGMTALSAWALMGVFWLLGRPFWSQGVPWLIAAVFSFGVAYWLFAMQQALPPTWAVTVAHLAIALAIGLLAVGWQRFRQQPWSRGDAIALGLPVLAIVVVWWLGPDDFSSQVRLRGTVFIVQMLWQIAVLLRVRQSTASLGWKLVLLAQCVQLLSLLPLVIYGERQMPQAAVTATAVLVPWVICMVMFLNMQATAYGYLLMLNDRQREMERKAAALDGLTQLASRRTLMGHAATAMEQAQRSGSPLGMLVLDIDHFKKVNDMYGHLAGDAVIQRVAWVLRNQVRQQDFAARYGGEEFVVLLPDATPAVLMTAAQRIADAVRAESVAYDGVRIEVTVSVGGHVQQVAPGLRWEELLAAADAALYEAKHDGRDRVVLSAVCRAQLAPALPMPGVTLPRRGPEAGERRDDAARG